MLLADKQTDSYEGITSTQLNSTQRCLFTEIYTIDQLQHGTETHTGLFAPLLLSSKS